MIETRTVSYGKLTHVLLNSEGRDDELTNEFFRKCLESIIKLHVGFADYTQIKFLIYVNEETVFYKLNYEDEDPIVYNLGLDKKRERYTSFFIILDKVEELICNSYNRVIECRKDRNSGWEYSVEKGWQFNREEWERNLQLDLALKDYLEDPQNNNIWIVTLFLPTMRYLS